MTGIVHPLRHALTARVELEVHPLAFLLAPHGTVRVSHLTGRTRLTGEYGLSAPTPAMEATRAYLFPSDGAPLPFYLVASTGMVLSRGAPRRVWTGRLEVAVGLPFGNGDPEPLDTYAPIELLFAPALHGYRADLGGDLDLALARFLRARFSLDAFAYGDRFAVRVAAAADLRLARRLRLSAGAAYYNYDQHAITAAGARRRSNDLFPLLDLFYAY